MAAEAAARLDETADDTMLDVDTSAAIVRWMETAALPEGVQPDEWDRWLDGGCQEPLRAGGMAVSPTMLGHWARSGSLR